MREVWKGIFKLLEEMGELIQVLGKLGPFPSGRHPDKGPPLQERLEEEIADCYAALDYFRMSNQLDDDRINGRRQDKLNKYLHWGLTGVPNEDQP